MNEQVFVITYTDLGGNTTERTVNIKDNDGERFRAICYTTSRFLTFRFDRVSAVGTEQGEPLDRDGWVQVQSGTAQPFKHPQQRRPLDEGQVSVLFTGLGKALKPYAVALAEEHDLRVVKDSISQRLGYLVTGKTPGPQKIEKAQKLGVEIITYEAFCKLIETGEVPNS